MIIQRYIATSILTSALLTILVLLSLFALFSFVDEFGNVGKGSYGIPEAFAYVVFKLVSIAHQLLPIAALMGTIVGLGALASNSELVAIRSAGFSLRQIVATVLAVGVVFMVLSALIGEYVVPISEQQAQRIRASAMLQNITVGDNDQLWARDGRSYINVGEVQSAGHLTGVSIYSLNARHEVERIIYAKEAVYQGKQWELRSGRQLSFQSGQVVRSSFAARAWEGRLTPDILRVFNVEPEQLSLQRLYTYSRYLKDNGLNALRYEQALWKKLVAPLVTGIMVVLAIPFVFGPLRSVSIGQRILVGVLVGLSFHLLNQMMGYLGVVYKLNPVVTATAPAAGFMMLALLLMRRVH